ERARRVAACLHAQLGRSLTQRQDDARWALSWTGQPVLRSSDISDAELRDLAALAVTSQAAGEAVRHRLAGLGLDIYQPVTAGHPPRDPSTPSAHDVRQNRQARRVRTWNRIVYAIVLAALLGGAVAFFLAWSHVPSHARLP